MAKQELLAFSSGGSVGQEPASPTGGADVGGRRLLGHVRTLATGTCEPTLVASGQWLATRVTRSRSIVIS